MTLPPENVTALRSTWNTDNRGIVPEVGDFVAYNYSGQLATGYVIRKSKDRRTFVIHQESPHSHVRHQSRVRGGAKCILVLRKGTTVAAD